MKRLPLSILVICALGISGSAHAAFSGSYDVGNWTTTLTGPGVGSVDISSAPTSVSLTSADDGDPSAFGHAASSFVDFTIVVTAAGTISFDWAYESFDTFFGPAFDPFFYLRNGSPTQLSPFSGSTDSGSESVDVWVGDSFGFRIESFDGLDGPAEATISNFNFTAANGSVPEPASLALLGLGLAGLGAMRRRKAVR